jgi:hypothetical protein
VIDMMSLEEALSPYSKHPTLSAASEIYLGKKWTRLCFEIGILRAELAAKDAELARLRGVEKVLRKARAFVGDLRGSQFASEQQHTEAYAVIHAIDNALAALPSPAEAGEKAKGWQPKCYACGQGPWDSVQGFASHKCQRPAAPSDAKAGERP